MGKIANRKGYPQVQLWEPAATSIRYYHAKLSMSLPVLQTFSTKRGWMFDICPYVRRVLTADGSAEKNTNLTRDTITRDFGEMQLVRYNAVTDGTKFVSGAAG
jgi:hypothetical protein